MRRGTLGLIWTSLVIGAYGNQEVDLGKSVVYSTTGFITEARKVASNPTVVTGEEIEKKNYNSVEEILEDIPSVNIVRQGKDYIIDLRGQGDKAKQNVQIVVDGVQMNPLDTSMSATPINTISPDDIERIEVIPGGGSVLYGSGTSGGVINIITKKGGGQKIDAGYEYGSYANKRANIALGESFGKFDLNLSYTNQKRDGYRDSDKLDSDSFMGNLRYRISDTQDLSFKYSRYEDEAKYPKMLTKEELNEDRTQSGLSVGEENKTSTDKDEYVITYNNKISNNFDFNMITFYQNTEMKSESMMSMGSMMMVQDSLFEDEKWGVKPKFRYLYGDGSSIIVGMDYIKNTAYREAKSEMPGSTSLTLNDLEKETISGYVMNNYVWKDFEFAQGFRYERANYQVEREGRRSSGKNDSPVSVSTDENNIAYEFSTNWLYSDTGKTYIRYEKGFTSPPPALLTDKNENGYYLNDLKSEKYDNIEIGVSDYLGFSSLNASIFYTVTKDEITSDMAKGLPVKWIRNYNLGETERVGVEVKTEQYFDKLKLSQSYSYIRAKIKDGEVKGKDISGNRVANVPEHKLNIGADYTFTPKFTVGGEIVYTGGTYINNENLGGRVNSHTVANIRARYSFGNGLDIYGGVNNLFNREYYEDVDYSNGVYTYDLASERNYYIGFRYSL